MKMRFLIDNNIGLHAAKGRVWLVFNAVMICLDNVLLKMRRPWMGFDDGLPNPVRIFSIGEAQDVHLEAGGNKSNHGVHVLRNTRSRVKRDRCPHCVDMRLRNTVASQKAACGFCAIDLKPLIAAAVCRHKTDVVEHGASVQKLRVEL